MKNILPVCVCGKTIQNNKTFIQKVLTGVRQYQNGDTEDIFIDYKMEMPQNSFVDFIDTLKYCDIDLKPSILFYCCEDCSKNHDFLFLEYNQKWIDETGKNYDIMPDFIQQKTKHGE